MSKEYKYMLDGKPVYSYFIQEHKYSLAIRRYKQGMSMRDAVESVLKGVDNRKHNHRQLVYFYKGKPIGEVFKQLCDKEYYRQKVRKGLSPKKAYAMTIKNMERRKKRWEEFYKERENEQGFSV